MAERSIETYEQAIEFIFGRINYERLHGDLYSSGDFKLDRMNRLLAAIDHPEEHLPVVHVAGSKGKGSTSAMIASALSACGHRTGLFTSPHVESFEERMTVDGQPPTTKRITDLIDEVAEAVRAIEREPGHLNPTYFEITTAIAWKHFTHSQADLAILEVGLGGRLDATNICHPLTSIITSISRDHIRLLGSDLTSIAREKAGIIKPRVPVISGVSDGDAHDEIARKARQQDAPLWRIDHEIQLEYHRQDHSIDVTTPRTRWRDVPVPLPGDHQAKNTALALAALDLVAEAGYDVATDQATGGIKDVCWPVRIEVLGERPTLVVDAAHNWASVSALLQTLSTCFPARRRVLIFATSRDKDVSGLLRQLLPEFDTVIMTEFLDNPRAVPVRELHRRAIEVFDTPVHAATDPATAWKLARRLAGPDDLVCVTGSFFIAAEVRELIVEQPWSQPARTS